MMDYSQMNSSDLKMEIARRRGWHSFRPYAFDQSPVTVGIAPGRDYETEIPDWPEDMNAAAELLKDMLFKHLSYDAESNTWNTRYPHHGTVEKASDKEPPRAVCIGWLMDWDETERLAMLADSSVAPST